MTKAKLLDIHGKIKGDIALPKCFSANVREDIVSKALEIKKLQQPYGPSPVAGNQYSASGKIIHQRHVWKSGYGRGMSRVPRKTMTRKGSQFNWVGATVPNTRGGRRAHPPKVVSMLGKLKINKKESAVALLSALSATAQTKFILNKYETLKSPLAKVFPLVVESKITSLKTKDLLKSVEQILGKDLFSVAVRKKSVRAGKGTRRGRKYKSNAGMLLVIGAADKKVKTGSFDVADAKMLGVNDLAKGGMGRLTIYTESAIQEIAKRFDNQSSIDKKESSSKKNLDKNKEKKQ